MASKHSSLSSRANLTVFFNFLVFVSCLFRLALALPATAALPQDDSEEESTGLRAFTLPKINYTFNGEPPAHYRTSLSELQQSYGNLAALPSFSLASVEERDVIGSDDRVVIDSTAFPYTAIGRVVWSDGTYCTGSLVGDRVVLTASHCVPWGKSGISMIFQPNFFDRERLGSAKIIATNAVYQNPRDNFNSTACGVELDFAILQTDSALTGKVGGYFGATQWSSSVANGLSHVGYPQSLSGGARQYQQKNIQSAVTSSLRCDAVGPLSTTCDTSEGHSGGPLWIPSSNNIVGAFSAGSPSVNVFASGTLASLVSWGRSNWK